MKSSRAQNTKRIIEAALRELLGVRPLSEITVKDVVERCGVSRQTFYYHFRDLYDVVEWHFQTVSGEINAALAGAEQEDRKQVLEMLVDKLRENRTLLLNIYQAFPRSYLERHIIRWSEPLLRSEIQSRSMSYRTREGAVDFIVDLYSFGIASVLLNWLDKGMPNGMVDRLDFFLIMLDKGVDDALRNLSY